MRVPDFLSLAGCASNDCNINNNNNNIQRGVNEYLNSQNSLPSSERFVKDALNESKTFSTNEKLYSYSDYAHFKDKNNINDLMPIGKINQSFNKFHNNNNSKNSLYTESLNTKQSLYSKEEESCDNNWKLIETDVEAEEEEEKVIVDRNACASVEALDLANKNFKVQDLQYKEECGDEYFSSSSSLSSFPRNSKGLYIPRGIVNPNYPGFQHLAHTLSEHFILSVSSTDDSDLSDNEMELSNISLDDISEDFNQNFSTEVAQKEKMQSATEKDFNSNGLTKSNIYNLGYSFETALQNDNAKYTTKQYSSMEFLDNTLLENVTLKKNISTTPDILMESNNSLSESQPDILDGVCLQEKSNIKKKLESEDIQTAVTPFVDIIGDFGEEVEREFGLLVNGYKSLSLDNTESRHEEKNNLFFKATDALLSDAKDNIDINKFNTQTTVVNKTTTTKEQNCTKRLDINKNINIKSRYQRHSYDERHLPPIGVDYSRCQTTTKQPQQQQAQIQQQQQSKSIQQQCISEKKKPLKKTINKKSIKNKDPIVDEMTQYFNLIRDKELILSRSRYVKPSSWAQYINDTENKTNSDILTPNALELFDAYKLSSELDKETLKKHLKLAKEIEKTRRNNREEIRRRLAGTNDNTTTNTTKRTSLYAGDLSSDNESHSSDSETCPKLSKPKFLKSINDTTKTVPQQHNSQPSNEDMECDFFTKQAVLQIEARMALSQAKEMATRQMNVERQRQTISPITDIIHDCMHHIGVQMSTNKRRVSRQLLTNMSIPQLQIFVNNMHTHIEEFNSNLMKVLLKRDDLHMQQDALLEHIEQLTRYLGINFSQQFTYPH